MRYLTRILLLLCSLPLACVAYEPQGTTVKKDKCNVVVTVQIGIETDTLADIAMIQNALNSCFGVSCDLPCEDGTTGKCSVTMKMVVMNWADLSIQDRDRFHHVTMMPGAGISSVARLLKPNSGKSTTGKWFRHEDDPQVYCHEVLHLCGLPDRYRECRRPRRGRVDNCKDGDTCKRSDWGKTPACPGYEDDCMGTDVTKPVGCNSNIMEIIRLVNDITLVCAEECCDKKEDHRSAVNKEPQFGVIGDLGLAHYRHKNKTYADDKINLNGLNLGLGIYGDLSLLRLWYMTAYLKLNYNAASGRQTQDQGGVHYEDHLAYRFLELSLGANARYQLTQMLALYGGPELALIFMAKYRQYGSSTYNGMTNNFGDNSFRNVVEHRNIQLGINLGIMYRYMMMQFMLQPYFNIYIPFTNQIAYPNFTNKMYNINLGICVPLVGK